MTSNKDSNKIQDSEDDFAIDFDDDIFDSSDDDAMDSDEDDDSVIEFDISELETGSKTAEAEEAPVEKTDAHEEAKPTKKGKKEPKSNKKTEKGEKKPAAKKKPLKSTKALDTLLDLAQTYISMEDYAAAKFSLQEVIEHGDEKQKAAAQIVLDGLAKK